MNPFLSPNQKTQLGLSLLLFVLCYTLFGWFFAQSLPPWLDWILEQTNLLNLPLSPDYISWGIQGFSILFIVLVIITLIAPFNLLSLCFGSILKSDTNAFSYVLVWSIIVILILCKFALFIHLLVLFSASILVRLDLQYMGYKKSQSFLILITAALSSLFLGLFAFYWFN